MKTRDWRGNGLRVLCGLAVLALVSALAAPRSGRAVVIRVAGNADATSSGKTPERLKVGMALGDGQTIRAAAKSAADFVLTTKSIIRLTSDTQLHVDQLSENGQGLPEAGKEIVRNSLLTFDRGQMMGRVCKLSANSTYGVRTPVGLIEVRGAEFLLWREGSRITVRVARGEVVFQIQGRNLAVHQGQQLSIGFDPKTDKVTDVPTQPSPAPTDDALSRQFADFSRMAESLEQFVCNRDEVDLPAILALATRERSAQVTIVNNPATEKETSPSSP